MDTFGDSNKIIADNYLKWFSENYMQLKKKYRQFCTENYYEWDEDIFSDTYLKIYESIVRNGLEDNTNKGFDNYTFKAFKCNIQREKQYARVAKRDLNYTTDEVNILYENYYDRTMDDARNKIASDLYKDFATLYLMMTVEENFDNEHFHLFKLKHLCGMTYKQIALKTNQKGVRQKILDVKNWLKDNVKKDDIQQSFMLIYGDLL